MANIDPYRFGQETAQLVEVAEAISGEVGLENSAGQEIDPATEQTVGKLTENYGAVHTQNHGQGGSFSSHAVPDGQSVAYKADPGNSGTVTIDGLPFGASEGIVLDVDDVAVPSTSVGSSGDTIHAIVEDSP